MMNSLVLKDALLTRKTLKMGFAYALFILIVFQNEVLAMTSYIMGAIAIAYFLVLWVCAYDEKNNSELILNSLPLKRETIVKARYFSVIIFIVAAIAIIGGMGFVFKTIGLPFPRYYMKSNDLIAIFTSAILLFSIYLPFFFRYGYHKARVLNMILFMFFFFIPGFLIKLVKKNFDLVTFEHTIEFLNRQPSWLMVLGLAVALLIIFSVSLRISVAIYRKREF